MSVVNTHSVVFDNSFVDFDIVALGDISGTMTTTFTFKDIFYQKGFVSADSSAVAVVDVSASDYANLFKLNVPLYDPSNGTLNTEQVRYLTKSEGWTDVSFSNAVVSSGAIFTSHSDQSIKKDYLRSMLKDITGTTRLNNLFKNQPSMLTSIASLDASFNSEVNDLLSKIEGAGWLTDEDYGVLQDGSQNYSFDGIFRDYTTDPSDLSAAEAGHADLSASTFSKFNPLRILSSSILGEEDGDDVSNGDISGTGLNNSTRREILIDSLSTAVQTFWTDNSQNEYIGVDASTDKWRVWLTNTTAAQAVSAPVVNGSYFSTYLDGYNLYAVQDDDASGAGGSLVTNVIDKEYPLTFLPGDKLHMLVNYKPLDNTFNLLNSNVIRERTYEVVLNMT
jgi:hypothetical protein